MKGSRSKYVWFDGGTDKKTEGRAENDIFIGREQNGQD